MSNDKAEKKQPKARLAIERIEVTWRGTSALLMHADVSVDTLDPRVKEWRKLTGLPSKKKTDDVQLEIRRREWQLALYHDDEIGPFIPGANVMSCIVGGAKKFKLGAPVASGAVFLDVTRVPLEYEGPRGISELWSGGFADMRGIVNNGSTRVIRTRPKFSTPWALSFALDVDLSVLDRDQVVDAMTVAGRYVGLGDFRPECHGVYGRFKVEAA